MARRWDRDYPQTRFELMQNPPTSLSELVDFMNGLPLEIDLKSELISATNDIFVNQRKLLELSKERAIAAMLQMKEEAIKNLRRVINDRDATIISIGNYFETLVTELAKKVQIDSKTGLLSHEHFVEMLERFLCDRRRVWRAFGIADAAGFKMINDIYGHTTADKVLIKMGELFRQHMRFDDSITREMRETPRDSIHGRFGGDEFLFFCHDISDRSKIKQIPLRFVRAVHDFDWSSLDPKLSTAKIKIDIGIVYFISIDDKSPDVKVMADKLLEKADALMYRAKDRAKVKRRDKPEDHILIHRVRFDKVESNKDHQA